MKKILKSKQFIFALAMTLFVLGGGITYILATDTILYRAKADYPLGQKQAYIIQPNNEHRSLDGELLVPSGIAYVIKFPGKEQQPLGVVARTIGSTKVDLEPFLNQEVYIYGYFDEGPPLLLKSNPSVGRQYINPNNVVLNIERIELAP